MTFILTTPVTGYTGSGGGVGGSDQIMCVHNGNESQTFGNDPINLIFDAAVLMDPAYLYSAGALTINQDGVYFISVDVSFTGDSSDTTTVRTEIIRNGVAVPGTVAHSNHVAGNAGLQTTTINTSIICSIGDVIMVRATRESGSGFISSQEHGCRLNMYKLR